MAGADRASPDVCGSAMGYTHVGADALGGREAGVDSSRWWIPRGREAEGVPRKEYRDCGGPAIPGGLRPLRRAARGRCETARGGGAPVAAETAPYKI